MRKQAKRIYISGAISGRPLDEAKRRFEEAEAYLKSEYPQAEVVSPMKNGLPASASWEEHMLVDLKMLSSCDAIYMLIGWLSSYGATIEQLWAMSSKKEILFQEKCHRLHAGR